MSGEDGVLDVLDGAAARRWAIRAKDALADARAEIDALNVYPVPDGDTGTNLHLTMVEACAAAQALPDNARLGDVVDALARGALMGARGNSGIITSQLLRGWADEFAGLDSADAQLVRQALARADEQAWAAVDHPVEGTILSVSHAAANAAQDAGPLLDDVVRGAVAAAQEALARTPEQLQVLRRAGVVDAGGRGLVVLLEALAGVVDGRSAGTLAVDPEHWRSPAPLPRPELRVPSEPPDPCTNLDAHGPSYEVMYLLDADDESVTRLRSRLQPMGDSLVVVGGGGLWHVHVHVDDAGAAVEAGTEAGRVHQVRVTHFAEQADVDRAGALVVACAAGPGLSRLFTDAGAVVVHCDPGRRASTGEVLAAIRGVSGASGRAVVVLPNDADTLAVARAAAVSARQDGVRVSVLPTRAQIQGLAALAVHDPARPADQDVVLMSAAAGAARHGAVTVAARDAITSAGLCRRGDVLGVVDGDFAVIGDDVSDVAISVLDRLLSGGGELVTLVVGQDCPTEVVSEVRRHLRRGRLDVEVSVYDGGQGRYPLLMGVE